MIKFEFRKLNLMECDVCLQEWNLDNIIPKILECGHSICKLCLMNIFRTVNLRKNDFSCPICKLKLNIQDENEIGKLMDNISLIKLVEQKHKKGKL